MEPVKRVPLVHQVEDQIEKLIKEEAYAPGTKLPTEMELCQALGVSRGTIREAFRYLQAKGVVELITGKGAFVAAQRNLENPEALIWLVKNEQDLKNVIDLRCAIEPLAARLAAERCDDALAAELKAIHEEFTKHADTKNYKELAELDEQFHNKIVDNCGNDFAVDIIRRLNESMKDFRETTFKITQNIQDAITPHRNVMRAIITHDAAKAEREMRKHLERVGENLSLNISSVSSRSNSD